MGKTKKSLIYATLSFMLIFFFATVTSAGSGITYHGRILRLNGTPVDGQFVGFMLRVMDGNTGTCEMYNELHTKDMRTSNGAFSITIGGGVVSGNYNVSGITFFDELFQNDKTFSFLSPAGCVGMPYVAAARDGRKLFVQFRENPAAAWEDLPVMPINHVPFAYSALKAKQVGAHDPSSLLRVENAGTPGAATALTSANMTELMALLGGTTTQYIKSITGTAGQIGVNTTSGAATVSLLDVATITPGTYGSATQVPVFTVDAKGRVTGVTNTTITGGGGGGITDLTGDVTASGTGSVAATIANNAVTTAKISNAAVTDVKLASDSVTTVKILDANVTLNKLAADSVNSAKIVDGSIVGADVSSTAALSVASVAATGNVGAGTMSTRSLGFFELPANGVNNISFQAPDNLAGNTTYILPAVDGGVNQVLKTDGAGNLSWENDATGGSPSDASYAAKGVVQFDTDAATSGITVASGVAKIAAGGVSTGMIANDAVNFSKMQNIATNKLLGRGTAASGDVEEITLGTGLSLSGTTLNATVTDSFAALPCGNGYLPYKDAGAWTCKQVASANTNDTIITRDSSGNFIASTGQFSTSVKITDGAAGGQVTIAAPGSFTSYNLTLPVDDGTPNQVLQTNGSGILSWTGLPSITGMIVDGGNTTGAEIVIGTNDANKLSFETDNAKRMTIDAMGKVGIGTTTPNTALEVNGSVRGNVFGALRIDSGTGTVDIGAQNGTYAHIATDRGAFYMNKKLVLATGEITSGSGGNNITLQTGGLTKMTILDSNGNVGIGTITPNGKLDVKGSMIMSGATSGHSGFQVPAVAGSTIYTLPSTAPTNGQVLSSDASGVLSWADVAAGAGDFRKDGSVAMTGALQLGGQWLSNDGGAEGIRVTDGGQVGVGVPAPTMALEIAGTGSAAATSGTVQQGGLRVGNSSTTNVIDFGSGTAGTSAWMQVTKSDNLSIKNALLINPNGGNVGIGLSSGTPSYNLEVRAATGTLGVISTTGTNSASIRTSNGTGTLQTGVASNAGGSFAAGTIANASVIASLATPLQFATGSEVRMTVDNTGNVGIGTMPTNGLLDVKGSIVMSGSSSGYAGFQPAAAAGSTIWTLPAVDGADGEVLKTNGAGILSWATPGSAGDASYAAKGVVQFDTNASTSGIAVSGGVAKLATSGVSANTYGSASSIPVLAVDAFGRITGVTETAISLNASAITAGTLPVDRGGTGAATLGSGNLLVGAGASAVTSLAAGLSGNVVYATGATTWASGTPDAAGLVDKASTQTIAGAKAYSNYLQMNAQNVVRFADSDSSHYVGFRGPATVTTNLTWTLPAIDGGSGDVLRTNGSGTLSWVTPSAAGEVNTVSNIGTAGVGIYKQKTGVNFELKKINAGSNKISITDDTGNNEVDIDINEANLTLGSIGGTLGLSKGGTNANITAANGGVIYSTASAMAVTAAGSTGQMLRSNGAAAPTWSTATYPGTTTANQILYSSAANTVGQISAAANGVLVTDGSNVPSIGSALPNAVQDNITRTGTITSGTWSGTAIAANKGGTGQTSYTVGDILYASGTSALSPLAAGVTSGHVLTSNGAGAAPSWQAVPSGMGGTGTSGYLSKFTASATLGNSVMQESSSQIGIGVSPVTLLHILNGDFTVDDTSDSARKIVLKRNAANVGKISTDNSRFSILGMNNKDVEIADDSNNGIIIKDGGNIGIGTTTAASRLTTVWKSGDATETAYFGSSNGFMDQTAVKAETATGTGVLGLAGSGVGISGYSTSGYGVKGSSGSAASGFFQSTATSLAQATLIARGTNPIQNKDVFQVQDGLGANLFNVAPGGNVGIGTGATAPATKLEIAGGVNVGSQTTRTTASNRGQLAMGSTYITTANANTNLDMNNGNIQELATFVCNGTKTITLDNVKDGAAYSLLISGTGAHSGTCLFAATGKTFKSSGGSVAPTASKDVLFTFAVIGSTIVFNMVDNLTAQ